MNHPELDVAYVAKLARLNLSAEETRLFQEQLEHVMEHVDKMREADLGGVEASAHVIPIFNVFREDKDREGLTDQEALRNAPRSANGLFLLTKVLE